MAAPESLTLSDVGFSKLSPFYKAYLTGLTIDEVKKTCMCIFQKDTVSRSLCASCSTVKETLEIMYPERVVAIDQSVICPGCGSRDCEGLGHLFGDGYRCRKCGTKF